MRRNHRLGRITVVLTLIAALLPLAGAPASADSHVVINEVLASTTGTDVEYVELYGTPGASLAGLSFIIVESDDQSSNGNIDSRYDFADTDVLGDNGFYLVGNQLTEDIYGVTPNAITANNFFENSSSTYALVETASISGSTVTGSETVIDTVASTDGEDASFFFFDAPLIGPDGSFFPAGVRRVTDGVDTDTAADWVIADFDLGPDNTPTAGTGILPPSPCVSEGFEFIHTIQGSGDASECVGDTVTIEGVVVGDYEGSSPALRGFYVQEEDQDADSDPATSEGIFVFHGNEDLVAVGDLVQVTGEVAEFQGQTQLGFPDSLVVAGSGFSVTPTEISLPVTSADAFEAVEGMLVAAPQTLYVTEFFQLGRFGQVVVSSGDRLDQPTTVVEPGADANALQATNDLNRLIIDDGENGQNPDPIVFGRNGDELTASNTLRGGDTATGTVGVMTYTWAGNSASGNAYRLRPVNALNGFIEFEATNPRPAAAPEVGGSVQVASFNVLNYFLTTDDLGNICGPGQNEDCRGADDAEEFERQRDKLLTAMTQIDAAVVGLIEMENTPGVSPEADIAAGLNDLLGDGTYAAIDAAAEGGGVVGADAIRVGMVYQPGLVTPLGDPALLDFSLDSLGEDRSRTAVAQSFVENATGEVFTAVVNHLKSKSGSEIDDGGGICESNPAYPDCDQGDGQGFFNATRTAHAQELADWLATDPTGSGDSDVLIIGDLNSYAQEDPIDALKAAGYVDLVEGEYTYVFDGQWGYLDYALASSSLMTAVTGAAPYHINADEPSVLDYNTNFKTDNHIEILYAPDEFRTSDHDPVLVGLAMDSGFNAFATPDELWPPNHKYREITLTGTDADGSALGVTIVDATSSEADSGLDPEDVPIDIVITGADTVDLRAERFALEGRVYTVFVRLTDGTQVVFTSADVVVPHDRGR
jgi:predicted extracellular nuclease